MKFLADEFVDRQIVDRLRHDGHTVLYVAEMEPRISDQVDARGLLRPLVLQKTVCGDAAFTAASEVTGCRPHHACAPDWF